MLCNNHKQKIFPRAFTNIYTFQAHRQYVLTLTICSNYFEINLVYIGSRFPLTLSHVPPSVAPPVLTQKQIPSVSASLSLQLLRMSFLRHWPHSQVHSVSVNVAVQLSSHLDPWPLSAATNIATEEVVARQGAKMWATMSEDAKADCGKEYFDSVVKAVQMNATSGVSGHGCVYPSLSYDIALSVAASWK